MSKNRFPSFFSILQLGEDIQKYPENDDGYPHIIDDYDSTITHHDAALSQTAHGDPGRQAKVKTNVEGREKADSNYEIPVIYSEIPGAEYDSLHPQPKYTSPIESPVPDLPPSRRPAVEPEQKSCCRKSPCLWGLLTAALTVIIVVLLVIFLTGLCFVYSPFSCQFQIL